MSRPVSEPGLILDEYLEALEAGGQALEQRLAGQGHLAEELKPLLDTAQHLRQARERVQPAPSFRRKAPQRLQKRLRHSSRPPARSRTIRDLAARLWDPITAIPVALAAAAILFAAAASGFLLAADRALPGDLLYPADRALENAALAVAVDPQDRLELLAGLAAERLEEARQLAGLGRFEDIPALLAEHNRMLALIEETGETDNPLLAGLVDRVLAAQQTGLAALLETLPADTLREVRGVLGEPPAVPEMVDDSPGLPASPTPTNLLVTIPPDCDALTVMTNTAPPPEGSIPAELSTEGAPGATASSEPTLAAPAPGSPATSTAATPPPAAADTPSSPDDSTPVTEAAPGQSGDAPGGEHSSQAPGQWSNAPGQSDDVEPPGKSDSSLPPGQTGREHPGRDDSSKEKSGGPPPGKDR